MIMDGEWPKKMPGVRLVCQCFLRHGGGARVHGLLSSDKPPLAYTHTTGQSPKNCTQAKGGRRGSLHLH